MSYTSLNFAAFVIILYAAYYVFPRKYRWVVLLCGSAFFYVFAMKLYSVYILATISTIYLSARAIDKNNKATSLAVKENREIWTKDERKEFKRKSESKNKLILILTLFFNFGILAVIKYFGDFFGAILGSGLILPLGISFYTFQSTGYLIDVYRENAEAESNPFKLALFISFFPQIIQGPIGEFNHLEKQLTEGHDLRWLDFKLGIELIVWGLFKKLIIADRAVTAISAFTANGGTEKFPHQGPYGGTAVLFVIILYALQLYADFSGGIEISRGVSRLFGIDIAVNFRRPYFATTLNDYWRRWHITLGAWMKKYVFYSLATSKTFLNLGKKLSKGNSDAFHKHLGKVLPPALATFVVFILVGIWHGSNLKYLAFGIWNGLVIMISLVFEPQFIRLRESLHIKPESIMHKIFQILRTFILVLIGYYFDVATNLSHAMEMLRDTVASQSISTFLGEWRSLGLAADDYLILLVGTFILLYFSIRMEKEKVDSPGELMERHSGFLQWLVILIGIILILIYGIYGPEYNPADFVYMQF